MLQRHDNGHARRAVHCHNHPVFFLELMPNYFKLDSGICIDTVLTLLLFLADMHFNGCSQALSGTDGRSSEACYLPVIANRNTPQGTPNTS